MSKELNTMNNQDESKEAITSDNTCAGCSAKEGQLHRWPCDNEECPFCGGQIIYCDCFGDLMDWAIQSTEPVDLKHFTEAEKERWLELIGNLKYQWEEVVDSPFETVDMFFECPPYWCKTKALLKAFWKIQRKFIKVEETLDYKWEEYCTEKGRIPYLSIPNICAWCGQNWPEMFGVPDREWEKYVIPEYQEEALCLDCYQKQKILFPDGWEKELSRIQTKHKCKITGIKLWAIKGNKPVCRMCGEHDGIAVNIGKTYGAKYLVPVLNKGAICSACFDRMRKLFPNGWKNASAPVALKK